jgi:L-threonylcarbamoyladenylate synthase
MTTFDLLSPGPTTRLLEPAGVERVVAVLRAGGLAVLPTETGHLLAAAVTSAAAIRATFAVKQRPLTATMHLACSDVEMAAGYADLGAAARRVLAAFTPGPVSVVLPRAERLAGAAGEYVTQDGTVGIRIPEPPATRQVIEALGVPVTATSLNRSGEESRPVDRGLLESFDWQGAEVVPAVVENAAVTYPLASTLVRLTGADVEILRPGPVDEGRIRQVLAARTEPAEGSSAG